MRERGFTVHEAARRFLAEFGGLRSSIPCRPSGTARSSTNSASRRESISTPSVGSGRGVSYLGMAPGGTVYRGMDDVEFLAENGDEALRKLIEGIR
ncbi:SUKH-3 domain-containing protein [Streptomyces sp. KN37]|uniref:SUKH-3 domain-containing protein n=1 Tax=Streptomyces sp. KN37 TaxID=3090667 RepID=UPI002A74AE6D|nr:SUKH-3 domain-containing protein [Streptomyces sp. KN37]WPO72091.1 SUKH-3 domain-containing protein [Streptomyces sp. KN37]